MSWLEDLLGGGGMGAAMGGGGQSSLMNMAKGQGKNMSIWQALGVAPMDEYTAPIGPGTDGKPMPSSMIDPALQSQQQSGMLANIGQGLSRFGAGMSKASGPSRMPVDFGQALAGGQEAMDAGHNQDIENQLKQAQAGAYKAKETPKLEQQAEAVMQKKQMGLPLTPAEQAIASTYDAFQNKMQTVTMPDGTVRQVPAQRPVFGQLTGNAPPGGGQAPRPDPQTVYNALAAKRARLGM